MLIQSPKGNKQIVIANTLNEARFKMSKIEQKLFLYCVGIVDNKDNILQRTFEMSVSDFADFLELSRKDIHKTMIDTTKNMASKVVEFYNKEGNFTQMTVLSTVTYKKKKGQIEVKVNSDIAPYLIDLKNQFTQYSLQEVIQFKSVYSMRIYQILNQWAYKEKVEYTIEELRFMFDIEQDEYKLYGHFKSKVLEVSHKEINKSSSLKYTYKEIKTGRKVTSIIFFITKKEELKNRSKQDNFTEISKDKNTLKSTPNEKYKAFRHLPYPLGENKDDIEAKKQALLNPLFSRLQKLGFSSENTYNIIEKNGSEYIEFAFEKSKIESRANVDNKAGYFQSVLSTYKLEYEDKLEEDKKQLEQAQNYKQEQEQLVQQEREAEEKFRAEQEIIARDILEEEPEVFCRHVYQYLKTFLDLRFGYTYHPDYLKNEQDKNHGENLKIAQTIYNRFLACTSLRDFRNLIKYDEDWLFQSVLNRQEQFDDRSVHYYKKILKLDKIKFPFEM
jgi:plasmid replication initiation protein